MSICFKSHYAVVFWQCLHVDHLSVILLRWCLDLFFSGETRVQNDNTESISFSLICVLYDIDDCSDGQCWQESILENLINRRQAFRFYQQTCTIILVLLPLYIYIYIYIYI